MTITPTDSLHLESLNEEVDRIGDYGLNSLGRERTRLNILIKARCKTIEPESTLGLKQSFYNDWEKNKAALEKEYAFGYRSR